MVRQSTLTQIHLLLVRAEALAFVQEPELAKRIAGLVVEVDAARAQPAAHPLTPAEDGASDGEDPAAFARHMIEVADTLAILGASLGSDIHALLSEIGDQIRDRAQAELAPPHG